MNKKISLILLLVTTILMLTGCAESAAYKERERTKNVTAGLTTKQPTPSDINFSLERYNLIRRAYWVNGQEEKSRAVECEVQKPLGYIILLDYGNIVGSYCVDGKVSSLNSFLTPDSEKYATSGISEWLADVDGSYGENDQGIFFFTTDGHYYEWTGTYLYSDEPFHLNAEPLTQTK